MSFTKKYFYSDRIIALMKYMTTQRIPQTTREAFHYVLTRAHTELLGAESEHDFTKTLFGDIKREVEELGAVREVKFLERILGTDREWTTSGYKMINMVNELFHSERLKSGEIDSSGAPYRDYMAEARRES